MVFIRHNAATIHSIQDCFTKRPVWPGLYRPLTTNLYYYLGRRLFANDIGVHHLVNVAFYLANGFLFYLLCLNLLPRPWALLAPVLWVSRYAHVEVVSNTCEFQGLLSVFFTLLALKLFVMARKRESRAYEAGSLAAFVLALLSKETAVVFPALAALFGRFFDSKAAWRHYVPPFAIAGAWTILFAFVLRATTDFQPTGFTYSFSFSKLTRDYTAYLLSFLNVLTYRLENIIMIPQIADLAGSRRLRLVFILFAAASGTSLVIGPRPKGRDAESVRLVTFGFLFFVIATAPYVILESRLFMRYSYFGHAGLALCLTALAQHITRRVKVAVRSHRTA